MCQIKERRVSCRQFNIISGGRLCLDRLCLKPPTRTQSKEAIEQQRRRGKAVIGQIVDRILEAQRHEQVGNLSDGGMV